MKKDLYTVLNDFSDTFELFDSVVHSQVIYTDNRLFQKFSLEWSKHNICDTREFIKNLKQNDMIMNIVHFVSPFASYGFGSNKLLITFKQDLKFTERKAFILLRYIIRVGNKR